MARLCMHDNHVDACEECLELLSSVQSMGDITFARAISESYENAKEKGFHDVAHTFGDRMLLAISELVEAFEEHRNNMRVDSIYFLLDKEGNPKPEGIPIEIADCLIRLFDDIGYYGIPIHLAYEAKKEYNKTRPHRHGGKRL